MTQPKAIFLAEVLEAELRSAAHHDAAAAELRRLHAQRDALLMALKDADEEIDHLGGYAPKYYQERHDLMRAIKRADDAIKAVENNL